MNLSHLSSKDRLALKEWAIEQRRKVDFTEFCCAVDPNAAASYSMPHLRKIAEALERVESGECKRLFITAPPRHWKSSISSEKFPLWFLARNPTKSVILTSHSAHLATGFSRNVRDAFLWNTNLHRLFPDARVASDYSTNNDWALETAHRSSFRAVGVGTGITGRGASMLIIDDPVADEKEAFSKTQRDATWSWYQNTARDRLDPGGAIVLIMSRWHADDLAGRLLKASLNGSGEPWEQLHLPAIDEHGQALWPERYPVSELEKIKQAIGGSAWNAKYQGNPRPDDGSVLDSGKLKMLDIDEVPALVKTVRRWDLAFSEREGADFVSGAKVGIDANGNRYIIDIFRIRGRWTESKPRIIAIAREDGPDCEVVIEANGTQLGYYQDINADQRMADRVVLPDRPEGSKEMRASVWGSRLEDGIIYCVRGQWNQEFFEQMDYFPNCLAGDTMVWTSEGEKPIKDIKVGDMCMTRQGYRRVLWAGKTGEREVITRAGITGTPEHRVWTDKGWKPLETIRKDVKLTVCKRLLSTTGKSITPTSAARSNGSAVGTPESIQTLRYYRGQSGRKSAGQFQKEWQSITRTATLSTTQSRTSNASRRKSTALVICNVSDASAERCLTSERGRSTKSASSVKSASGMRKDTKSDSLESWKQSVEDVGSISVMSVSNVARLRSIARRNAGTKQPCAGSGKRISVYDLTIEGNHEFFANGVLVHNCEHDDDVDAVSGAMKQLAYGSVNLA